MAAGTRGWPPGRLFQGPPGDGEAAGPGRRGERPYPVRLEEDEEERFDAPATREKRGNPSKSRGAPVRWNRAPGFPLFPGFPR